MSSLSDYSRKMNSFVNRTFKSVGLTKYYSPKPNGVSINGKYSVGYDDFFIRSIKNYDKVENFYYYTISAMDTILSSSFLHNSSSIRMISNLIIDMVEKFSLEDRVEFSKELHKLINSKLTWDACDTDLKKLVYFLKHITRLYPCSVEYYMECIIYIWYKSKENFFKLFLLFTDFTVEVLDLELDYLEKTPKKVTKLSTPDFVISNTPMFCLAKYVEFCIELSEQYCDSFKSSKDNLEDMIMFNNPLLGDDEILNDRFKHKVIRNFVNKMLDAYIGEDTDDFYNFYKTSNFELLKNRDNEIVISMNFDSEDTSKLPYILVEVLYRNAKSLDKKVNRKVYNVLVQSIPSYLWLTFEQNIMFLGYDLLLNDNYEKLIKERNSLKEELSSLNDKYKIIKSNVKSLKREVEEAKKSKFDSENKFNKCKRELDSYKKASVSKDDFDEFEQSYNVLLKQISDARSKLSDVSNKLDEKTSECSRLIKENKRFKSKLLKLEESQSFESIEEVKSVPLEEKLDLINNFNVVILGGLYSTAQSLKQMGYSSFTLYNDVSEIVCGSSTDLIVIFTSYVSHKMTNYVKSHYSDIDLQYFNSTSPALLIDLIYNYFNGLLSD